MGLNPFKDANLNDLQSRSIELFTELKDTVVSYVSERWTLIRKKGNERVTLMFIPHSEKQIINFHISIFSIVATISILVLVTVITSVLIVNHASAVKEVSKLKTYGADYKVQIQHYQKEINNLHSLFQQFKPEITYLYALTPGNSVDTLWARGGGSAPQAEGADQNPGPSVELLNLEEMEKELSTTHDVLEKIREFLQNRKKIIENTPSLWPVNGYIVSTFGRRTSPVTFREEYSNGIDISAFPGAEIRVTAPGVVNSVYWDNTYGLCVSVRHSYGFITVYAHCQRVTVEEGQKVSKGEVIAFVGRTGRASRHICHYQVKIGTEFVDPLPYLNKIITSDM